MKVGTISGEPNGPLKRPVNGVSMECPKAVKRSLGVEPGLFFRRFHDEAERSGFKRRDIRRAMVERC